MPINAVRVYRGLKTYASRAICPRLFAASKRFFARPAFQYQMAEMRVHIADRSSMWPLERWQCPRVRDTGLSG
jgi:hypothetical protein